jgi:Tol biopolymer transport system component/predicted Ser/Thr protein kinase
MGLTSGTKLGPYEIIDAIGAGGMGEVYRARDTRLERTVAIKVLAEHLANTPEARQRFEHEARAVSGLNHANICTLFDVGSQNGTEFLVMEYLEGETLASRLEKGPLPLTQALKVAMEVADALDKAHRAGIIHRDLKPGNIMLTKSGSKLLDFGLAKAAPSLASSGSLTAATRTDAAAQPLTQHGMIVGTFQYMSPEQVEANELDTRSDLFSFGSVLYEMLTGRAAFQGRSQLSVASAILEKEPEPIGTLQPMTPPALDRTVRKCLAKDPEDRWQTARDLLLELKWIAEAGSQAGVPAPAVSLSRVRQRTAWAVAAVATLISIAATIGYLRRAPKANQPVHLSVELGADASLATVGGLYAILSPDGTRLAFAARGADQTSHIYIRSLDQLQAAMLSDTEGAHNPFFSNDGQWIAFFAKGTLKKISVQGGAVVTLCDAPRDYGGSWGEDDTIVFSKGAPYTLFRVSAMGGVSEPLTSLDEQRGEFAQAFPQVLPGGKAVLYTSAARARGSALRMEDADIVAYSISSRKYTVVQRGGFHARYLPSGHLVYMHNSTLFAVPFNLKRLEVTGQPAPVLEGVASNPLTAGALFSFSDTGTLIYVAGSEASIQETSIYWMDARGEFSPLRKTPGVYGDLAFSPDGKKLAMDIVAGERADLWVYEWERGTFTRVTSSGALNVQPSWSPDGQRIAYGFSEKGERPNIWWMRADGAGVPQRLTESKLGQHADSWTPDGKVLAFFQVNPDAGSEILTLPIEGSEESGWKPGQPKKFVADGFFNAGPVFSPDGHWIAYVSNQSGRGEIYVQPYPGPGARVQVSADGGGAPEWSNNGKELFFSTLSFDQIMVTTYTAADGTFRAGKPRLWSPGQFTNIRNGISFALHPDGKRFAVLKADKAEATPPPINKITFILNFFDELRGKATAAKN